ncbi:hypothetical protein [Anaeromicropila herbilytica]|uniref:Peptidylprolyl isomerase n=1 Tax=Anaeromicropila herbilytica TaxID=2785025 RepID=A0A7R7IE32_9FIRM|nr:hypothetical protein [Anaeromicropila herbilytica]BCN32197.1 hypothetical protein bsdtb5_34920 [Anaeromicropila herbilytica]
MKKNIRVLAVLLVILILAISTACNKDDAYQADDVVVTVDQSKIHVNEMMYHIMLTTLQGQMYASFLNDTDFWNKEYKDGKTMGDVMKEETLDNAIKYELLYQMAIDNKYKLTDDEVKNCESKVESIVNNVPKEEIAKMNLTEEDLLWIQEKITLSTRYYEDNYKNKGIDDETAYKEMKKGHEVEVNEKIWNQIDLGEIKK